MVSTRSNAGSSPASAKTSPRNGAGTKRKADSGSSPSSKHGKKNQKTLEETILDQADTEGVKDIDMLEAEKDRGEVKATTESADDSGPDQSEAEKTGVTAEEEKSFDNVKKDEPADETAMKKENVNGVVNESNGAIEKSPEKNLFSNIIEKGVIYFFTRGRVGVEDPDSVQDLQRSFMVLRPLPHDAKLGEGAIQDLKNNRLIAIPKKVLPKSHKDRFMAFVEKGKTSMEVLKENFFKGAEYQTQTAGVRQTPPVTPVGEGVYAITVQGNSTHLAYLLTIPETPGEVQDDMGVRNKASFLLSLKNPKRKGPANATLPQGPGFPQTILDEFRGRAWMPIGRSEHMDYPNAQFLLIGEGEEGFEKATEILPKDEEAHKETPAEEVQELEDEDEIRVENLHGDNTVFDDLGISHKDYPKVMTTW